jgi:hypothetical protein
MSTLENIRSIFTSTAIGNDHMCPLCHRSYTRRRYIAQHIAIHCPEADRIPFPNSIISELYKESTNMITIGTRSSRCTEWSNVRSITGWNKDQGLTYEIQLKNGSISYVAAKDLLKSKSGSALVKLGYRLRKSGSIPERSSTLDHTVQSHQPPRIIIRSSVFASDQVDTQVDPPEPVSTPIPMITLPVATTIPKEAPLFPIIPPVSAIYPGCADPRSVEYILSRIVLTAGRIKCIRSTITKWHEYTRAIRSVGTLLDQAENYTVSVLGNTSSSTSHKRNTLQNMLVFLRTLIRYERSEFILIKASAATKFITVELRKLNIAISKIRTQSASLESQKLSGKYISSDLIAKVSKKASTFIKFIMDKFWIHKDTRFPSINRHTRSLYSALAIQDAKFFQVCLLWKLFSYWTPQRSGRIVSLEYDRNLIYDQELSLYYFKEGIDHQKSATARTTPLGTHQMPVELSPVLDFNLFFIIPRITASGLRSIPNASTMLLNSKGGPPTTESVNLMITRLVRAVDPSAPHLTCQTLRKLSQTYFFATDPSQDDIDAYNRLADHTLTTSLLYYKLFVASTQEVSVMLNIPSGHSMV